MALKGRYLKILFCPRCLDAPLVAAHDVKAGEKFIPVCRHCNPEGNWTVAEAEQIFDACDGVVQ